MKKIRIMICMTASIFVLFSMVGCNTMRTSENIDSSVTEDSSFTTSDLPTTPSSNSALAPEAETRELADLYIKSKNNQEAIAMVNGEPINKYFFLGIKKSQEISRYSSVKKIDEMNATESEKDIYRSYYSIKSDEEILNELIRDTVIVQAAKKRGIEVTDQEIADYAENQYRLVSSQDQVKNSNTMAFVSALGTTLEALIKNDSLENYKDILYRQKFYNEVVSEFSDIQKIDEKASYDSYVDSLVAQANIEKYN